MLIDDLGYRAPAPVELSRVQVWKAEQKSEPTSIADQDFVIPLAIIHDDPLISYSGIVPQAPLGAASLLKNNRCLAPSWFLISPTWSIEDREVLEEIRLNAILHRQRNPLHRLIFLCNSREEVALVHGLGEAAIFHNKTTNVTEGLFKPLAHVEREFDAIYNAHLGPWKRHELTLDIDRCGFIFYRAGSSTTESEAALIARHAKLAPGHVFINEIGDDGLPVRLPPEQVNHHLNQASIGLCLSAKEGAMIACAEYLLAGLPVITTPNQGGRDFYLNDEFCITVPADPRAIAESVAALKARNIPRDYVREQTLKRMQPHRRRFVELIDSILAETNAPKQSIGIWPSSPPPVIMRWFRSPQAYNHIMNPAPDAFGQALMGSGDVGKSSAIAAAGKFLKRRIPAFGNRS